MANNAGIFMKSFILHFACRTLYSMIHLKLLFMSLKNKPKKLIKFYICFKLFIFSLVLRKASHFREKSNSKVVSAIPLKKKKRI